MTERAGQLPERCNHPLGQSGNMAVTCARPTGHDGEHRSVFEVEPSAATHYCKHIRLVNGGREPHGFYEAACSICEWVSEPRPTVEGARALATLHLEEMSHA